MSAGSVAVVLTDWCDMPLARFHRGYANPNKLILKTNGGSTELTRQCLDDLIDQLQRLRDRMKEEE